ncbi:low molecular weight protein-tyrosine-phosphatase [Sphingomonas bisphenolicum]|uniref:protein-tyrosine-phosphatase n=1 Tax=Sphingomonas bisphenolicum TaxID=296544 RepID=A0ABM7FZX0_9SPHN|nr:low molecular weight protein-tyrosine-phosphatase [Sphingomonas bisphenolicum]BBF68232.1 phosphotyrosine protein phosphatase [Sphingomonas bisphenolicum]
MTAPSVLFVCLGNICRSPLAEAALRAAAEKAGIDMVVDSAGTGDWHVGSPPDPRAQAVALRHGIDISGYAGRQVSAADFRRFTHIFALDADNLKNLRRIRPSDGTADLRLLMDMVPGREGTGVVDPYFGDEAGFDQTWDDVARAAGVIVAQARP